MARPRKRINQGLPQGLVCRNRKRADGSIVVYYYYTMADKKEVALGKDKHIAILEAAKLNMQYLTKKDNILFIEVLERYEKEVVPLKKAKNTRNSNIQAIKKLRQYFQDPPFTLDEIEPIHIREYLDWRKTLNQPQISKLGYLATFGAWRENGVTLKRSAHQQGLKNSK